MATTLYLRSSADMSTGYGAATGLKYTNLASSTVVWSQLPLIGSIGASSQNVSQNTVAGTTPGVELGSTNCLIWVSLPLAADVTISGNIITSLWAVESSMSANVAINARIMRLKGVDGTLTEILKTTNTSELANGTAGSQTLTQFSASPASTNFVRGDRIAIAVFGDDAGTMGSGFTFTLFYNDSSGNKANCNFQFTETLSFESAPSGTSVYPTATSAGINPGSATEYEAWTSRGGGVSTSVTNTVDGPIDPGIQATATAGGTAVEWYTKPIQAVTLAGAVLVNVRGKESNAIASALYRVELAVTDSDGTNPTVWGVGGYPTELATSETAYQFWVDGASTSIADNKRIRIRFLLDDAIGPSTFPGLMVTGETGTLYYAGAAGATGDTYLTFPVTLAEFTSGTNAPAELATGTGAAYNATINLTIAAALAAATAAANAPLAGNGPLAGLGSATGVAYQPTLTLTSNAPAGLATATGAAYQPIHARGVNAGLGSATGVAYQPTLSLTSNAPAGLATGTGAAYNASLALTTNAGLAAATGLGYDATVSTLTSHDANAELAVATGAAQNVTSILTAPGGLASATGAAQAAVAGLGAIAGLAGATGAGLSASTALTVNAPAATVTGAGYDATVSTATQRDANAELAAATGAAYAPTSQLTINAQLATATDLANQPTVSTVSAINAPAELAAATGLAYDALSAMVVNAQLATAAGAAYNALAAHGVNAQAAAAIAEAYGLTASLGINAGLAAAIGLAYDIATVLPDTGGLPPRARGDRIGPRGTVYTASVGQRSPNPMPAASGRILSPPVGDVLHDVPES